MVSVGFVWCNGDEVECGMRNGDMGSKDSNYRVVFKFVTRCVFDYYFYF